jgi:tRNA dimethylallyltransferase
LFDELVLSGPTGSGKSRLGVELAERLGAEIVSMDSMALYRGMDIGTAKPSAAEQARVRHHLIDVLEPWESASVAWWLEQARQACTDIRQRGRRPLFVGGTPLYLKALLYGLFAGPPADLALRQRLEEEAGRAGGGALHARLAAVDPASAARLHPNDLRRVIRALEVWELTGKPLSAWQTQWRTERPGPEDEMPRVVWLDVPRAELYRRIDARVVQMVEAGLVEETRRLVQLGRPLSREARQAVGYREMFAYLEGRVGLEEAIGQIQQRTRQLAKRQLTWLRQLKAARPASEQLTFALWRLTMDPGVDPGLGKAQLP